MKLWHDDIRRPPAGWTWARTNGEALELLRSGTVVEASLDHDLGLHELDPADYESPEVLKGSGSQTGFDLVKLMVAEGLVPRRVRIHSWNPPAALRMAEYLVSHTSGDLEVVVSPFDTSWWDDGEH